MKAPKVPEEIIDLLAKVHFMEWTLEEQAIVDAWLSLDPHNEKVLSALKNNEKVVADLKLIRSFNSTKGWERQLELLNNREIRDNRHSLFNWKKVIYVAAALALIVGYVFTRYSANDVNTDMISAIEPGRNEATITLADGTVVSLESNEEGIILGDDVRYESGSKVDKHISGVKSFEMNTPRGGQYKLTLPDGSRVWMNSETRLAYAEDSKSRSVDMEGEAYFEVKQQKQDSKQAKDAFKPFVVKSNDQLVKVVGTHFNIKSYKNDNKSFTTLVEGEVHVHSDKHSLVLSPGEQSVYANGVMDKKKVDISSVMAWKEGFFVFNAEQLDEILKQVGRWYDVDFVISSDKLKTETFEVMVPRFGNLNDLLDLLQKTGKVKFDHEGRVIHVKGK